ncbi:hypothetical protein M431DRAFT_110430 [Trichoderma harzianum CBS 226.95]|uniref:L-ascorbic acid binding protein n=1 Tax=Trichoderma harzianum CBS 226.95 TaxID=983964 RepID=A0A2T4AMA8_TRIHA|nr:hypothetical protein M431DRAFT_110430 [Trichoderma harzianum CBS 226.95]PTB58205.1 hypothetical protein M431DRAFT_110430 [Trichoderma harzianum CBS 226.95]
MSQPDKMGRFIEAMKTVYGPFDELSSEDANDWIPPDNPGAGGHRGRYLWTDAFGVVNFITLFKETAKPKYLTLAKRLVVTVHDILGRTRDGKKRLDGATDKEPLVGGLRIGKLDASGSDGDGQYHHYLTLWMFALNRLSIAAGERDWNDLGIQLARAIHPRFLVHCLSGGVKMVWKISMDMKSVLVPSEGHLDAATGYVVYKLMQTTASKQGHRNGVLQQEINDYWNLMSRKGSLSPGTDMLDLGMGLWMCHIWRDEPWAIKFRSKALPKAEELLDSSSVMMQRSASRRLAFREFGTCVGVSCIDASEKLQDQVEDLLQFWEKHLDRGDGEDDLKPISRVMYATGLVVGAFRRGYLEDEVE